MGFLSRKINVNFLSVVEWRRSICNYKIDRVNLPFMLTLNLH